MLWVLQEWMLEISLGLHEVSLGLLEVSLGLLGVSLGLLFAQAVRKTSQIASFIGTSVFDIASAGAILPSAQPFAWCTGDLC